MKTASQATDPRSQRTRARINDAFVALPHRRRYDDIRVSDIVRKAGVGRATFYAHFGSKHELLRAQLRAIVVPMLREVPEDPCLFDCTPLFRHVAQSRDIYRSLYSGNSRLLTERMIQRCFEERVLEVLSRAQGVWPTGVPFRQRDAARFAAAALMALASGWIDHGSGETAEEMQAIYRALVGGGLAARHGHTEA